ncbi:MAG: phosphotransferase, partial [Bacteroidota bacterium]
LKAAITGLGKLYLSEGPVLIHGDFYPGSWLRTENGLKVIDAEFSFRGYAEFDLGVFAAHMALASQGEEVTSELLERYAAGANFDERLMRGFAGTEILRRLLGVAQLPLVLGLEQKQELMVKAAKWIMED